MFNWKFGLLGMLILFIFFSCKKGKVKNIPDVSKVDIDINIKRLDKAIFEIDTTNIDVSLVDLNKRYPEFMDVYLRIIQQNAPSPQKTIYNMISPEPLQRLYDTCQIVFPDMAPIETDFESAFQYFKHYFPERPIPEVYTCLTALNYGVFTIEDSILVISLDFFLGEDFPLYKGLFPRYVSKSMSKDNIVKKGVEAMINNIIEPSKGEKMLDIMINNGKKMYVLDYLMPHAPDSIKWGFSQDQVNWCKENEMQMWAFFLEKELLYSTKRIDFQKYVDESPSSPGMPREAPGKTANWMGWKIVEQYMERFPETSLEELAALNDAQTILTKSRYKPKKTRK